MRRPHLAIDLLASQGSRPGARRSTRRRRQQTGSRGAGDGPPPRGGRLRRIFRNAGDDLDVIAIINGAHPDPNFFYISGYRSGLFEGNLLFLFPDGHVEVVTNPLEEQAARQRPEYSIHVERGGAGDGRSERRRIVTSILKDCTRVGINFSAVPYLGWESEAKPLLGARQFVDVSHALSESRLVKDPDELETISKAALIISDALTDVPELLREGMTERSLKAKIDYSMVEKGADSPSFDSIIAFGENSAIPHYSPGERRLRRGDAVLIDVGAKYRLYCSDITRTFFFGRASALQRQVYAKVLEAQTEALAGIREGVTGRAVHQIAARTIDKSKFKGRFTHGLGHSLGIEVHDGPGLTRQNARDLKRGMVVTVEPGIYLPGKGGVRIEDDVVVTKTSCKILTKSPREFIEV
jgi:Xaa-Pro dipeptidase